MRKRPATTPSGNSAGLRPPDAAAAPSRRTPVRAGPRGMVANPCERDGTDTVSRCSLSPPSLKSSTLVKSRPPQQRRGPRMPGRGGGGGGGRDDDEDVDDGHAAAGLAAAAASRCAGSCWSAVAIVILLIGGYWYVQRCQRNEEVDAYKSYVRDANAVTAQANRVGKKLRRRFLKQGQTRGAAPDRHERDREEPAGGRERRRRPRLARRRWTSCRRGSSRRSSSG